MGLATAAGSAALADMVHSIRARFPRMPIIHAPCLVQGAQAAASICAALGRLQAHPEVEVIICGRGGGSLEDLWAFNEEAVVRAISACRTVVVSAVGHETDTTLADLAADLRAKTPTAAGELVVPVEQDLLEQLANARRRLDQEISQALAQAASRLRGLATHRALSGPGHLLAMRSQRLDELTGRLRDSAQWALRERSQRLQRLSLQLHAHQPRHVITAHQERLAGVARKLEVLVAHRLQADLARLGAAAGHLQALSPLAVVARGYSVVLDERGAVVRRLEQAPLGSRVSARVLDGWLQGRIDGHAPQELGEGGHALTRPSAR